MVQHLVSGLDLQLFLDGHWVCSLDHDLQLLIDVQQQLGSCDHLILQDAQLVACS